MEENKLNKSKNTYKTNLLTINLFFISLLTFL